MKTRTSFPCFDVALGYDNGAGEWDEYPPYLNAEGLEIGSPVSILCHCFCSVLLFSSLRTFFQVHLLKFILIRVSTMKILLLFSILGMVLIRKCHMDLTPQLQHLCLP